MATASFSHQIPDETVHALDHFTQVRIAERETSIYGQGRCGASSSRKTRFFLRFTDQFNASEIPFEVSGICERHRSTKVLPFVFERSAQTVQWRNAIRSNPQKGARKSSSDSRMMKGFPVPLQ
jgi:hypothetical protein